MFSSIQFRQFFLLCITLLTFFVCVDANAAQPTGPSLGQVAGGMLEPMGAFSELFYDICYIIGGMLLMGSAVQYKHHRDTPTQVPVSKPVVLLILGLAFVLLPIICKLSQASGAVS